MLDQIHCELLRKHDRMSCKIQAFGDNLKQVMLEKEALAVVMADSSLRAELLNEIRIYKQIIESYSEIFGEILHRE